MLSMLVHGRPRLEDVETDYPPHKEEDNIIPWVAVRRARRAKRKVFPPIVSAR